MNASSTWREAYLGVDVGTSSVKALLIGSDGEEIASSTARIPLIAGLPLQAEQDAEVWWQGAVSAIQQCLASAARTRVLAVGLTGQKHALMGVDEDGHPVAPALTWADGRARAEAQHVRDVFPAAGRRVGRHAVPGLFLPKWLYFRERAADAAARAKTFLFAKDYVRFRLTGTYATDWTEASASLLFDFRRNTWSSALTGFFELEEGRLPAVLAPAARSGTVNDAGAAETGLPVGIPVAAGAGDNEAAALAVGGLDAGAVAVTLGTSGTLVAWSRIRSSASGLVWNRHVLRAGYAATGTVLSAGRALRWIRDTAYPEGTRVVDVLAEAKAVRPSPAPLVFLPSLEGERSPVEDPDATGAFLGLRTVHTRAHLARAVLEGISLSLAESLVLMRAAGVRVDELRITGGGAASRFWRRLLAAASGTPVRLVGQVEGPALGAALLAAAMDGQGDARELARTWVRPGALEEPDAGEVERLAPLATMLRAGRNALRGVRTR
ncbi:MAG: FGGY family carbohydrate kinase [Planctomycetota bacterium]|nr:FGGY family carbohydrate kinase [Planctomycetota bacterium]